MKVIVLLLSAVLLCSVVHADQTLTGAAASSSGNISGASPTSDLSEGLTPLSPNSVLYSPDDMKAYILGPGDILSITVTPQDRYSLTSASIMQDGTFMYPYNVGQIKAVGLTVAELQDQIQQKLSQYCVNPDVTVVVTSLRPQPVYVTGGVASARILDVRAASTVAKAILLAGGATDQNMLTNVTIFRGTQTLHANVYPILTNGIDNGDNILLEPNDMVVVPMNTAKIEVLGAVGGPGVYPLRPPGGNEGPMRMSDAISAAGGASREGARVHEVRLVREGADGKPVMTNYDYGKFMQFGDMSQNPILQDKDMIIIPDSRTKPSVGDVFNYYGLFSIFKAL